MSLCLSLFLLYELMFHRVLVMESWCALFGIAHFWLSFFVAGFQRFFIQPCISCILITVQCIILCNYRIAGKFGGH